MNLRPEARAEAERLLALYPQRRAAILPLLWLYHAEVGEVNDEVEREIAALLGISPAQVREVSTFYTMFRRPGTGRHVIQVCHTLSCALGGAAEVVERIRARLGIGPGETTPDRRFTLVKVECLGSCDTAPCLQVNDIHYHHMTPEKLDALLEELIRQ